jgi:hypothetical protein
MLWVQLALLQQQYDVVGWSWRLALGLVLWRWLFYQQPTLTVLSTMLAGVVVIVAYLQVLGPRRRFLEVRDSMRPLYNAYGQQVLRETPPLKTPPAAAVVPPPADTSGGGGTS